MMAYVKRTVVWMLVTRDRFELPIAIAESATELASILGTTKGNITSSLSHQKERSPYRKVIIPQEVLDE